MKGPSLVLPAAYITSGVKVPLQAEALQPRIRKHFICNFVIDSRNDVLTWATV